MCLCVNVRKRLESPIEYIVKSGLRENKNDYVAKIIIFAEQSMLRNGPDGIERNDAKLVHSKKSDFYFTLIAYHKGKTKDMHTVFIPDPFIFVSMANLHL